MTTVHKRKDDYIQFTKGAPDVVLTVVHFIWRMDSFCP